MITLHAAKGLEFPAVFIIGMDEGSLPHSRSVSQPEQLEEERRLVYVGITRAMRHLYLVRARRRSFFGESHYTEPSRFLEDIPGFLTSHKTTSQSKKDASSSKSRGNTWEDDFNQDIYGAREGGRVYGRGIPPKGSPPSAPSRASFSSAPKTSPALPSAPKIEPVKPKGQQFKPGDRVRHDMFGEGIILKSDMETETEFVEVLFQGKHGKKRLSMDFAKLEKL